MRLTRYLLYRAIKCANVRDIGFLEVSVEESLVLVCTFALERTCLTTKQSKKPNPRKYVDFVNSKCAAQKGKCAHVGCSRVPVRSSGGDGEIAKIEGLRVHR